MGGVKNLTRGHALWRFAPTFPGMAQFHNCKTKISTGPGFRNIRRLGVVIEPQELTSYLDTNVVIFLHSGNVTRLSGRAEDQIESTGLLISAMVMLELEMLYEKNALAYSAAQIFSDLNLQMGLPFASCPWR